MFCTNCGNKVSDDAMFCPECGARIRKIAAAAPIEEVQPEPVVEVQPEPVVEVQPEPVAEVQSEPEEEAAPEPVTEVPVVLTEALEPEPEAAPEAEKVCSCSEEEDAESFTLKEKKILVKILAVLCYTGLTVLIPVFLFRNKPYIRKHANNGLLLLLLDVAAVVVCIIPVLGWLAAAAAGVYVTVFSISCIINVIFGDDCELPILGKIQILKAPKTK